MTPELEHYHRAFQQLHADAAAALSGLPPEALNWRPLEGDEATNSLAITVTHMAGSERFLVGEVAGERPAQRDRDAEFRATAASAEALAALLDQALAVTGEVLTTLPSAKLDETVPFRGRTVTRRWAVLHALEHFAMHVGHMQLTRQLWQARGR